MIYIGIDNGVNGGMAAYTPEGPLEVIPMPKIEIKTTKGFRNEYNIPTIVEWLRTKHLPGMLNNVKMAILERAQPFPGMPVQSTFLNARNFGIMEGIFTAMSIPYTIVHSKTWQKKMFEGISHTDTKQASVLVAQRLFPGIKFIGSGKATKLHDGMTDAALMAYYGYLLHK